VTPAVPVVSFQLIGADRSQVFTEVAETVREALAQHLPNRPFTVHVAVDTPAREINDITGSWSPTDGSDTRSEPEERP
jgi:hypothetical protein